MIPRKQSKERKKVRKRFGTFSLSMDRVFASMMSHSAEKTNISYIENDDFSPIQIDFRLKVISMVKETVKTLSSMTNLFWRIQLEHLRRKQHKRRAHFKYTFACLLGCVSILYLFGYHVRVYNVLAGPFHVDFNQLMMSLDDYVGKSNWLSLPREYLQVELGENQLEQEVKSTLDDSFNDLPRERLSHTLITIKDHFYVQLATPDNNYFHNSFPYRFRSFTEPTLKCIAEQLDIATDESMLIKAIEEIYRQNTTAFHMKVIAQCGILIGYLTQSRSDVIFDASSTYYSSELFLLGSIIFGWLLIKALFYLGLYVFHAIHRPILFIHSSVKLHLNTLHIDGVEELDDLLSHTIGDNNYHNRLFLLRDQYLLILHIDRNEHNAAILHQFYDRDPLTLISIENIVCIQNSEILTKHGNQHTWHPLPTIHSVSKKRTNEWLHQKLMLISTTYQEWYVRLLRLEFI